MARHKCIVCFGQSNMEGEALLSQVPSTALPRWIGKSSTSANTVYQVSGINYWMADLKTTTTINNYTGKFTPFQFDLDLADATWGAAANGYLYSSTMTRPLANPPAYNPQKFGPDVELAWQIAHEMQAGEDLYVIKLAIHTTYLSRFLTDTSTQDAIWLRYADVITPGTLATGHNDWNPTSAADYQVAPEPTDNTRYDLFGILTEIIFVQAQSWIHSNKSASDDLDVIGVFVKLGESDSADSVRAPLAYQNMKLIRDQLRAKINQRGMTSKRPETIPFIIAGHDTNNLAFANTVNAAFQQLADDDQYTGYFDTTGYPTNAGDTLHINATGMITLGQTFYTTWKTVTARETNATRVADDLPTLSSIRTLVKRRYERNTASNEAGDTIINAFINDTVREVNNTLGDDCWFKRQVATLVPSGTFPATFNLPRSMKRLLRIESTAEPGRAMMWKGIGYTDNGRLQITLHDYTGGPYIAHFIVVPKDMVTDTDTTIIPQDYLELVVVLTCKRLAESAGNVTVVQYWQAEVDRLWKYVKRDVQRYDRMRQESLAVGDTWDTWRNAGFPDPLWYL